MYDINTMDECAPFRNILDGVTLREYQAVAAYGIATCSGRLLLYHTGLGKTLATIAGLCMRYNAGTSKRILWIAPLATIDQIVKDFANYTQFNYCVIRGNESTLRKFYRTDSSNTTVFIVNLEAFDNLDVVDMFHKFSVLGYFDTVVVDEAHQIANPFYSNRNSFVYMLAYRIQNCYLLTATPVISNIQQYATLIALATKSLFELFSIRAEVHMGKYQPENVKWLVSFKEREGEYNNELRVIPVAMKIARAPGISVFNYTRGADAPEVNNEMLEIVRQNLGKKFLVHCLLKRHHGFLKKLIEDEFGLKVGVISSDVGNVTKVQEDYNNNKLDCLILSYTTGLNLPSNYMIMYDWTVYASQAAGRGLREQEIGDYIVYYLLATVENEINLFNNSVIKNGLLTKKALGRNPLASLTNGGNLYV